MFKICKICERHFTLFKECISCTRKINFNKDYESFLLRIKRDKLYRNYKQYVSSRERRKRLAKRLKADGSTLKYY